MRALLCEWNPEWENSTRRWGFVFPKLKYDDNACFVKKNTQRDIYYIFYLQSSHSSLASIFLPLPRLLSFSLFLSHRLSQTALLYTFNRKPSRIREDLSSKLKRRSSLSLRRSGGIARLSNEANVLSEWRIDRGRFFSLAQKVTLLSAIGKIK